MHSVCRLLLCLALGCVVTGLGFAEDTKPETIKGWGTVINPDGDCTVKEDNGAVRVRVPDISHDLWYGSQEKHRFNAPRVLQPVQGDFVTQVKVTADWKAAGSATPTNYQFIGAGLVVWDSPKQYFRLERNLYINPKDMVLCYTAPLYDLNRKRVTNMKVANAAFFKGDSTWLRLDRTGQKLTTSISHDGTTWTQTGAVTTEFPETVELGIHAVNTSTAEFVVKFEDLTIRKK